MIILDYNKTKGAVDTLDQMCHKYTVKIFQRFSIFILFSGETRHKAMATVYFLWEDRHCCHKRSYCLEGEKSSMESE